MNNNINEWTKTKQTNEQQDCPNQTHAQQQNELMNNNITN